MMTRPPDEVLMMARHRKEMATGIHSSISAEKLYGPQKNAQHISLGLRPPPRPGRHPMTPPPSSPLFCQQFTETQTSSRHRVSRKTETGIVDVRSPDILQLTSPKRRGPPQYEMAPNFENSRIGNQTQNVEFSPRGYQPVLSGYTSPRNRQPIENYPRQIPQPTSVPTYTHSTTLPNNLPPYSHSYDTQMTVTPRVSSSNFTNNTPRDIYSSYPTSPRATYTGRTTPRNTQHTLMPPMPYSRPNISPTTDSLDGESTIEAEENWPPQSDWKRTYEPVQTYVAPPPPPPVKMDTRTERTTKHSIYFADSPVPPPTSPQNSLPTYESNQHMIPVNRVHSSSPQVHSKPIYNANNTSQHWRVNPTSNSQDHSRPNKSTIQPSSYSPRTNSQKNPTVLHVYFADSASDQLTDPGDALDDPPSPVEAERLRGSGRNNDDMEDRVPVSSTVLSPRQQNTNHSSPNNDMSAPMSSRRPNSNSNNNVLLPQPVPKCPPKTSFGRSPNEDAMVK